MRILFGSYSLAFQNPGGGELVLEALEREVRSLGHEVEYYSPWTHGPEELRSFDVVHYFSCVEPSFWKFLKHAAPKTPLLVTPTLYQSRSLLERLSLLRRRIVQRNFGSGYPMDLPDYWFPTTPSEADVLERYWGVSKSKMTVLPNGVDSRFLNPSPDLFVRTTGITEPFILHVGRFHPVKNHLTLIEAIRKIGTHCVFIGSPDTGMDDYYKQCLDKAKAAESADPSGKTRFTFLSRMSHDNPLLPSAYAAAKVFVLPSKFETFGIAALEALASGCALVLTRHLESRETFAPYGQLIDPSDTNEIAQAISKALSATRESARSEQIHLKYNWKAVADRLISAYERQIA